MLLSADVRQRRHGAEDELSFSRLHVCARDHGCLGWTMRIEPRPRAPVPFPSDYVPNETP